MCVYVHIGVYTCVGLGIGYIMCIYMCTWVDVGWRVHVWVYTHKDTYMSGYAYTHSWVHGHA